MLVRHLLGSLYAKRLIARRNKDSKEAAEITAVITSVRKQYINEDNIIIANISSSSSSNNNNIASINLESSESMRESISDGRSIIRQEAIKLKQILKLNKGKGNRNLDVDVDVDVDLDDKEKFEKNIEQAIIDIKVNIPLLIEKLLVNVFGQDLRIKVDQIDEFDIISNRPLLGDQKLARACRSFCIDIETLMKTTIAETLTSTSTSTSFSTSSSATNIDVNINAILALAKVLSQGLFDICDRLRTEANEVGLLLED